MPNKQTLTIDLSKARTVGFSEIPEVDPITGVQRAGVNLTYCVLGILSVFIILVFLLVNKVENRFQETMDGFIQSVHLDPSVGTLEDRLATIKEIDQFRQNERKFVIDLANIVIINALLPVLTALLGYIFGTTNSNGSGESSS